MVLFLAISPSYGQSNIKKSTNQPNILLILCDDLGYADVGFNGSKDIKTPSLDALAKQGTIFSSAYVAHSFCGPSRASLMTGRYAHKIGAQYNLPPNNQKNDTSGVTVNEKFISSVLKDAGYHTGLVGKWHLGETEKYHPNNRGFDDFYGFLGGGHSYFPEKFKAEYNRLKNAGNKGIWDYLHPLEHNGKEVDENEYITDALSRESVRFINDASKTKKPFFLFLSYNAPHTPLEAKEEDLKLFENIKDQKRKTYAAMVYAVDRGVDRIVKSLKENGQFNNTLIIFLSDNGGRTDQGANNFPLKDGKGSACEGGFRVPMFFHWPKVVPAGKTFDHPVSALDFYPTFANLAGAKLPANKLLDGKNIWNDFLAGKSSRNNENIFVLIHKGGFNDVGIRNNNWKALKTGNQPWKLFDMSIDLGEKNDVGNKHPETLKKLIQGAENWSKSNVEPLWFHDIAAGLKWQETNMPNYNKTFKFDK